MYNIESNGDELSFSGKETIGNSAHAPINSAWGMKNGSYRGSIFFDKIPAVENPFR